MFSLEDFDDDNNNNHQVRRFPCFGRIFFLCVEGGRGLGTTRGAEQQSQKMKKGKPQPCHVTIVLILIELTGKCGEKRSNSQSKRTAHFIEMGLSKRNRKLNINRLEGNWKESKKHPPDISRLIHFVLWEKRERGKM